MKIQGSRVDRFFQKTSHLITGIIQDQIDGWSASVAVEPSAGPAQQEFRMKKMLRQNQARFGKESVYVLSNHFSLAEHYRSQRLGMEADTHYQKSLQLFEAELQERGELPSLQKLIPACIGGGQDAASLYEKAADFYQLYGGSEKSLPLLQRAQELLPEDADFPRRCQVQQKIARVHMSEEDRPEAQKIYGQIWNEALQHYSPTSPELGLHAEDLARSLGPGAKSEELWGLSLSLAAQPRTASALSSLAKQYAAVGCFEHAQKLRNHSESLQLEDRVRSAPVSNLLRQDLKRLVEIYQACGDAGSAERAQIRLAHVETRLALKAPLSW